MAPAASALLTDIDKDTVDFQPNYDEKELEPVVLPARIRTCWSMARAASPSAWPPTSRRIISARSSTPASPCWTTRTSATDALLDIVPGPDFPTGGEIMGRTAPATPCATAAARSWCAAGDDRDDPQGPRSHRRHPAALSGQQTDPDRTHRRNGPREADRGHFRRPRRIRPRRHADGHRAEARCLGRCGPEPAVALHRHAEFVRRQHAGAEPWPPDPDGPAPAAGGLPRVPRGSGRPPHQVRTGQGPRPRPRAGRSGRAVANIDEVIHIIRSSADPAEARERLQAKAGRWAT
jgi:DNA gyrase subunit A